MRLSANPIQTLKDVPAEAEITRHRLMLRAGLIRRVAGGLYTWLPMGLRVLRRVERVIREEMDRAGALEVLMPALQPPDIWQQSGRYETARDVLFKVLMGLPSGLPVVTSQNCASQSATPVNAVFPSGLIVSGHR